MMAGDGEKAAVTWRKVMTFLPSFCFFPVFPGEGFLHPLSFFFSSQKFFQRSLLIQFIQDREMCLLMSVTDQIACRWSPRES
jgi:hypothetical protein